MVSAAASVDWGISCSTTAMTSGIARIQWNIGLSAPPVIQARTAKKALDVAPSADQQPALGPLGQPPQQQTGDGNLGGPQQAHREHRQREALQRRDVGQGEQQRERRAQQDHAPPLTQG